PTKAVRGKTPIEAWTERKPNLNHLKIFGCRAFVHIPKVQRQKLESKSKEYIFVGYCTDTKGYKLADPKNPRNVIKARDVIFIEDKIKEEETSNESTK
ncbi:hypothetical protein KPH14_012893, partial [Odynerus spinipes]